LISFLAVIDLGYSLVVVSGSIANLIKKQYIPELCDFAAFWEVFCIVLSVITLNVIAYHLWTRVSKIEKSKLPWCRYLSLLLF